MYWFGSNPVFLVVKQLPLLEFLQFKYYAYLFASKLKIFEVTNFAPDLPKLICMFSLNFINNYAIFKVVRI